MLVLASNLIDFPILSIHVGGEITRTARAIVDPEDLSIIAFELVGGIVSDPEIGNFLMVEDIREYGDDGFIVDSADVFVEAQDVIRLNKILKLNFNLRGLKVVTKTKKKIGKVVDYTVDSNTFSVYQLVVQRPLMQSFVDPQLTINRSQITEIDDYSVTIDHDKEEIKLTDSSKDEEFVPNFVNPFRKPNYAGQEEESSVSDNSSKTSE